MNICFFNHYAVPPNYYPLARQYYFGKYLIRDGNEVKIFAASTVHNSNLNLITDGSKYKKEIVNGIEYVYIKAKDYKSNGIDRVINMFDYFFGLFKVFKKVYEKNKPDIIIATTMHPLTALAGIMIAKKYKIKCVVEIADLWPLSLEELDIIKKNGFIAKSMYILEHWLYKHADSLVFTMEGVKQYISDQKWTKDIDLNKVYYINNGVDLEDYTYNKENYITNDDDLNKENLFKIIYCGSIRYVNKIHMIVDVAKKLVNYNMLFIVYGDGDERKKLEEYCLENNINNIVFKGKVEKKYVPYILTKSDLNIFTGMNSDLYKYGLSLNKLFDYTASCKPTISNMRCGYDILERGHCGITIDSGNVDDMANSIIKFYNMSKVEYENYCENASKTAKEFDFRTLTNRLENVINNTLVNKHKELE